MKVCPVCKSRCFDDMGVCYGCLHKFEEQKGEKMIERDLSGFDKTIQIDRTEFDQIPEYFELDTFPFIEEVEEPRPRGAHEKVDEDKTITIKIPVSVIKQYMVIE